jgi:hypothetical protein
MNKHLLIYKWYDFYTQLSDVRTDEEVAWDRILV